MEQVLMDAAQTKAFRGMLKQLPDDVLFAEAKRRTEVLRERYGKYATMKKIRRCNGCHEEFTARQMRSHPCVIPYSKR